MINNIKPVLFLFLYCVLTCTMGGALEKNEPKLPEKLPQDIDLPLPEYSEESPVGPQKKDEAIRRDPFGTKSYSGHSDDSLVPAEVVQLPDKIRVVAIVHVKGESPIAVIDIPDGSDEHLYFVRKGETIQYQTNNTEKKHSNKQRVNKIQKESFHEYYLFIKDITKNSVEISPKEKPKETRILR